MIIYNVTIKVDWRIHDAWLQWMKETHMNEVVATGCFVKHQLLRLIEIDETDGPTYASQYFAESEALYNHYLEKYAALLRKKGLDLWGEKMIAFRSVMQVVD